MSNSASEHGRYKVQLEESIRDLQTEIERLSQPKTLGQLIEEIRHIYHTSVAEFEYEATIVQAMRQQIQVVATLQTQLLRGAQMVNATHEAEAKQARAAH